MKHYLKKIAVSGAISATLFAVFFYFVYAVENEKYAPKTASSEKAYAEETLSEVNTIVVQAIEQEIAKREKYAQAPTIQRIATSASPQALSASVPTVTAAPLDIPSIPSALPSSAPITIPALPAITIPTIPSPAPAPRTTITTTPTQPKPAPAPAPRTTVS